MSQPIDEVVLDYYLPARGNCFLPEPSVAAAAAVPSASRIFFLATQMKQSAADAIVAPLASARPLLSSKVVRDGVLYVFGPAASTD